MCVCCASVYMYATIIYMCVCVCKGVSACVIEYIFVKNLYLFSKK